MSQPMRGDIYHCSHYCINTRSFRQHTAVQERNEQAGNSLLAVDWVHLGVRHKLPSKPPQLRHRRHLLHVELLSRGRHGDVVPGHRAPLGLYYSLSVGWVRTRRGSGKIIAHTVTMSFVIRSSSYMKVVGAIGCGSDAMLGSSGRAWIKAAHSSSIGKGSDGVTVNSGLSQR